MGGMDEHMRNKTGIKKYDGQKLIKVAVTVVAALLLCALYTMIFQFSAQDSEKSGNLSLMISEKCVNIVNDMTGKNWTYAVKIQIAQLIEHPIRKMAHFSEYACMGFLVYTMWRPWRAADAKLYSLSVIWVFISAALDEAHQYFVPGRYNSFADVLLDTAGGVFGVLICICIRKICAYFFRWMV